MSRKKVKRSSSRQSMDRSSPSEDEMDRWEWANGDVTHRLAIREKHVGRSLRAARIRRTAVAQLDQLESIDQVGQLAEEY